MINTSGLQYHSLSGFTAGFNTPKQYFTQIVSYIPGTLDKMTEVLNMEVVEKIARICVIAWFIFRLLKND